MNTYLKYLPNVFLAKCPEKHEYGETIKVSTKYGKENDSIIFNLIFEKDGFYYYSITRADGFNAQEFAKRKAERLQASSVRAAEKSGEYFKKSGEATRGIEFGQPILVGHHSEARHRAALDKSWNAMGKSVEYDKKADNYESRAEYWEKRANIINLSMPESLEFYEYKLEIAKSIHNGLKNGTIERTHSYSLTYAKKELNDLQIKLKLAQRLWLNNTDNPEPTTPEPTTPEPIAPEPTEPQPTEPKSININLKVSETAFDEIISGSRSTLKHGFSSNKKYTRLFENEINMVNLIASKSKRTHVMKFNGISIIMENDKKMYEITLNKL